MSVIALPKNPIGNLRELGNLQDIPVVRQLGLFGLVAAAIAVGLWLFFWTQKPDYVPVFAGADGKATSEASELLTSAQIPFRIDTNTGALAVAADNVGEAKMALASAGMPANSAAGFEAMQGDQGFGTSQFVENARYQHALEIELARTIANLRPVSEARVHLALPKPSAFTRQKEPASASVVLQLRSGNQLEQNQVNAIVHLVASSIPNLPPSNVTVLDQFGRMLSDPDPNSEAAQGAKQFEQQRKQEAVYVQRIHELLEPMTGPGRVSAQVSVDMDFSQTEEAREKYGPDPAIVRSEQVSESGNLQAAAAATPPQGVPGSASNTPAATAAPAPAPAAAAPGNGSRTAVRNFEIDRTLTHTRQSSGRISRVTAAVLIDNVSQTSTAPAGDSKAAKPSDRSLSAVEIKRIETLVQQAIGYSTERGDMVSVVNAPFAKNALDDTSENPPIWENPRVREILRIALGGIALLMLIMTVLRPAARQLLGTRAANAANAAPAVATVIPAGPAAAGSVGTPPPAATINIGPGPAALDFDNKLQAARAAVSADPKRVAQVVRGLVDANG